MIVDIKEYLNSIVLLKSILHQITTATEDYKRHREVLLKSILQNLIMRSDRD